MEMIEKILEASNLTKACNEVVRNKGAGGIDKMPVRKLKAYLDANRYKLCESLRSGDYLPQPIRGKQIPKSNGKKRLLGIPTAVDCMLHQATLRVVMPQYETEFSEDSYGYIHKVIILKGVHELAMLGSTKPQYASGSFKSSRLHQFRISGHPGD